MEKKFKFTCSLQRQMLFQNRRSNRSKPSILLSQFPSIWEHWWGMRTQGQGWCSVVSDSSVPENIGGLSKTLWTDIPDLIFLENNFGYNFTTFYTDNVRFSFSAALRTCIPLLDLIVPASPCTGEVCRRPGISPQRCWAQCKYWPPDCTTNELLFIKYNICLKTSLVAKGSVIVL